MGEVAGQRLRPSFPMLASAMAAIARHKFDVHSEAALQDGLLSVLTEWAAASPSRPRVEREVRMSKSDRLDFLILPPAPNDAPAIAVEVKIKGTAADLIRQLWRYAKIESVGALLVVSTKRSLLSGVPRLIDGKSVAGVCVGLGI